MSVDYKVRQIYNVVIKEVTETQESWKSVLRLAGQIYRYEFDNVLMVYAQKPHVERRKEALEAAKDESEKLKKMITDLRD